jgi:hypothetical protein
MVKLSATAELIDRMLAGTVGLKRDPDGDTYLTGLNIHIGTTLFGTMQLSYVDAQGRSLFELPALNFRMGDSVTLTGVEVRAKVVLNAADEEAMSPPSERERDMAKFRKGVEEEKAVIARKLARTNALINVKEAKIALKQAKAALRKL